MKVQVDLFADLRRFDVQPSLEIDVPAGSTVRDILSQLRIPDNLAILIVVNEEMSSPDREVCEGDRIGLFPPMGGG